jgi:2-iminobutanoate/2-iminopropanoate deaminase
MDWDITYNPAYWEGKRLAYPEVPKEHPKFAQSIAIGNLLFVSGCGGQDTLSGKPAPDNAGDQVTVALDKARKALEAAGTSMENIVKTFFLVRSLDDYQAVRKSETEYYEKHAPLLIERPPAATLMVVPALARPEYLVEYEVIAAIDRNTADWGVTYYPEFWGGKELAYPHVPKEHAKFARTQVVGNLVIVSGCQALDHDTVKVETSDFIEQSEIVLEKIKIGMEETGGSLASVVKTNVFLKDLGELQRYREVERAFYEKHVPDIGDNMPASTAIIVDELPRPEFLVEVEAIGVGEPDSPDWPVIFYPGSRDAAASVGAGNLLFLSGCDGGDGAGTVEDQIIAALDQVQNTLAQAGSSMDNIVKTLMMLRHVEDYPAMRKAEVEYYEKHAPHLVANPPVSTFVQLPAITRAGGLFQIDVTAVR